MNTYFTVTKDSLVGVYITGEEKLFESIKDLPLSKDAYIAGGAVRSLFSDDTVQDIDVFFTSQEAFDRFKKKIESKGFKSRHKNDFNETFYKKDLKVQLIKHAFLSAQEMIETFDFTICQMAYDGEAFLLNAFSLYDLARKKLVPARISFAASTLRRIIKYTKRGYHICGGGLATILQAVADNPAIINQDIQYID